MFVFHHDLFFVVLLIIASRPLKSNRSANVQQKHLKATLLLFFSLKKPTSFLLEKIDAVVRPPDLQKIS